MLPPCAAGRRRMLPPSQRGPVSCLQIFSVQTQSGRHSVSATQAVLQVAASAQRKPPQSAVARVFLPLLSQGYEVSVEAAPGTSSQVVPWSVLLGPGYWQWIGSVVPTQ